MKFIKWFPIPLEWKARIAIAFQKKFALSSLAVIVNKKQQVLLFHHTYRHTPWGLPGGFLGNEDPESAIKREILEESGLQISNLKIVTVKLNKVLRRLVICYTTNSIEGEFAPSNEVSEMKYFSPNNLPPIPNGQKEIIRQAFLVN